MTFPPFSARITSSPVNRAIALLWEKQFMSKAGRIVLLACVLFSLAGTKETYAKNPRFKDFSSNVSSCSSVLVSTDMCTELASHACLTSVKNTEKQIQAAVVVTKPKETKNIIEAAKEPEAAQENIKTETAQDDPEIIFELANKYRQSLSLPVFEKDDKLCSLAVTRSTELAVELSNGVLHSGLYNRNLPYWVWENAKVGTNEEETVKWWIGSPIHNSSLVGDYKYSCVACSGSYCSELFTSFILKTPVNL